MDRCCHCIPLKLGGLIIGAVELIAGIAGFVLCAFFLTRIPGSHHHSSNDTNADEFNKTAVYDGAGNIDINNGTNGSQIVVDNGHIVLYVVGSFYLMISIAQITISLFLLYGIIKESIKHLNVWLTAKDIFIALIVIMLIGALVIPGDSKLHNFVLLILCVVTNAYTKVVSQICDLIRSDGGPPYVNQTNKLSNDETTEDNNA